METNSKASATDVTNSAARSPIKRWQPSDVGALIGPGIAITGRISSAAPIKSYFTQRAQISALKSQVVTDRTALDAARAELELWKDPDYVKSQARERLHFDLHKCISF